MKKTIRTKLTFESKEILELVRMYGELFKGNTPFTEEEWPTPETLSIGNFDYDEELGYMICLLGITKRIHYNVFFIKEKDFESYVLEKEPTFKFDSFMTYGYDKDILYLVNDETL